MRRRQSCVSVCKHCTSKASKAKSSHSKRAQNTDATILLQLEAVLQLEAAVAAQTAELHAQLQVLQFNRFTSTKVQILTQTELELAVLVQKHKNWRRLSWRRR